MDPQIDPTKQESEVRKPEQEIRKLDPETSVFRVSRDKNPNACIFIAKIFLRKHGLVQLHGLGEATKVVAIIAEDLKRNVIFLRLNNPELCYLHQNRDRYILGWK